MDAARFQQLEGFFGRAVVASAADRARVVAEAAAFDPEVGAELARLLAVDAVTARLSDVVGAAGVDALADGQRQGLPEVPGFKVLRRLGGGGMGIVYEAEQLEPRRRVALKLLRSDFADDELRRRFEAEARVLARLEHANIARVFAVGSATERPYIAMEFIDGETLERHAERARLDIRARVTLLARICRAIEHAHQRGVVHRDLKPDNLLVGADGEPKVVDFGVARARDDDLRPTSLHTLRNQLLGTLPYMSPEQLAGDPERVDARTDVYSLGVVAYELLAGRRPFEPGGRSLADIVKLVTEGRPAPLGTRSDLGGDLACIVAKAMAPEPDRRYGSASLLAEDFEHYLRHEPIAARPASTLYYLRKFARRQPLLSATMLTAVLAVSAGLVVALVLLGRARQAETEANLAAQQARHNAAVAGAIEQVITEALTSINAGTIGGDPDLRVSDLLDRIGAQLAAWRVPAEAKLRVHWLLAEAHLSLRRGGAPVMEHAERALAVAAELGEADSLNGLYLRALRLAGLAQTDQRDEALAESRTLLALAESGLEANGDLHWKIRQLHAKALRQAGHEEEAERFLREALALARSLGDRETSHAVDLRCHLAEVLAQRGDHDGARALLEEARALAPSLASSVRAVARNLQKAGDLTQRLAPAAAATPAEPPADPARAELDRLEEQLRRQSINRDAVVVEARRLRQTLAAERGPEHPTAIEAGCLLGTALHRQRRFAEARDVLVTLVAAADRAQMPRAPFYHRTLGLTLANLGDTAAAEPHLRQAITALEADPSAGTSRAEAMAHLGYCLLQREADASTEAEAERWLQGAIDLMGTLKSRAPRAEQWLEELRARRAHRR